MPLRGLRPGRSDKDLKRRSTLDPTSILRRGEQASRVHSAESLAPHRGIQSSDGVRPRDFDPRASWAGDAPPSPPIQEHNAQTHRFSVLRVRHASDPQLSQKAKEQAAADAAAAVPPVPAMPAAPAIITTAPTMETPAKPPPPKKKKFPTFLNRRLSFDPSSDSAPRRSFDFKRGGEHGRTGLGGLKEARPGQEDPARLSTSRARDAPAENGNQRTQVPGRLSDSSRSDGSSGEHVHFATNKRQLLTSRSAIFRLPRRNKEHNRKSLFPLPVKIPAPPEFPDTAPATPRASTSAVSVTSPQHSPDGTYSPPLTTVYRSNTDGSHHPSQSPSHSALASVVNISSAAPQLLRNDSTNSARSAQSSHSLAPPARIGVRDRSSTMGSSGGRSDDDPPPTPPYGQNGRNSTSTTGRASFSNLFGLGARFRQNSEPHSPRHGSPGLTGTAGRGSHSTSLNISREALVIPPREEGEPPGKYLERLEDRIERGLIACVMAKIGDDFSSAVLRSYMRKFMFFGDPIDMALRKLLMEVELPKESQQIDRVLQGFADRYHECNPGIFVSPEEAYFIAFSIVLLNSDFFNPNNKRKMQKPDYIKNCNGTSASVVNEDVLATIYDNIVYTQFIHIDDEVDLRSLAARKNKKKIIKTAVQDPVKKAQKEPIDPYTLIFENKLDILRPPIKDVMQFEDPYSYRGTAQTLDLKALHMTFAKYGVIQIVSARSRPEAFMSPTTIENPDGAQAGVVEMPVTKVGVLWRKDTKKKAARSPWQEWGAILTRSGLSFFKNAAWAKTLMHQHETHERNGGGSPVIFKPPVEDFKADHAIPMDQCVAAMDMSYRKHKHAFVIFAKGGAEEVFLADSDGDMNDWLAKVNYTATFETVGIRPRGLIGGHYEGQRSRGIRRLESSQSSRPVQTPTGEVFITSGRIDHQLAQQIATARRENIQRKVEDAEDRLGAAVKQLDHRLRDARHLQVMAPIQPRTRDHVMHAAGRMAAKLKWIRIEIVRMKAHRDILIMDLDEEKKSVSDTKARYQEIGNSAVPASSTSSPTAVQNPRPSRLNGLVRLGSKASSSTARPQSPTLTGRPDTGGSEPNDDDIFATPPETSHPSPGHPPPGWEIPPMSFGPSLGPSFVPSLEQRNSYVSSTYSHRADGLGHRQSVSTIGDHVGSADGSETGSRYRNSSISDVEQRNHSASTMNLDGRPQTPTETEYAEKLPGSPESRSKVRRSLHRTLRETHSSSGHRRSGKGKESNSSIGMSDHETAGPTSPEMLPRTHASFTVHGKKASVVTFGAEWQNLSAEDRLKLRKQATDEGTKLALLGGTDDDAAGNTRRRAASTTSEGANTIKSLLTDASQNTVGNESGVGMKPLPRDVLWSGYPSFSRQEMADSGLATEELSPTTTEEKFQEVQPSEKPNQAQAAEVSNDQSAPGAEDEDDGRVGIQSSQPPQAVEA